MLTLCDHASFICHGNCCGSCGCTIFPTMCLREAILHEDGNGSYYRNVDLLNVNWHAGAFTTVIGHMKAKGCIVCILERTIDTKHMSPVLLIAVKIARGVNYMVLRSICKRARDLVLNTCLYLHGTTTTTRIAEVGLVCPSIHWRLAEKVEQKARGGVLTDRWLSKTA
jgi:hypothetical protein